MSGSKLVLLVLISLMLVACASNSYKGEKLGGKRHGQGTATFADGGTYIGEWANDKVHGMGTRIFSGGDKYVGEYKNNERHGQGTYTYADGSTYIGEWANDKFYGMGKRTYSSGKIKYDGEYKNYERHGQGSYTFPDGGTYIGEWANDKFHGMGTRTYSSGKIKVGIWANHKLKQETLHPNSTMLINGGSYTGGVANGKPSGKGVYTRQLRESIAVKVYSDHWTGEGAATEVKIEIPSWGLNSYYFKAQVLRNFIASGTIKVSEGLRIQIDKPFSEMPYDGVDTFPNASFSGDIRYVGELRGYAKKSTRIKEKSGYTGVLDQRGRKQGPGKLVTVEKRVYSGGFKDDLFHGDKTYQYYDGVSSEVANYFNGFKIGYGRIFYPDGTVFKTIYDKGRAVDGTVTSKGHYITTGNSSTHDHDEGKVQYLKNNQVVTEYDLSSPSKFTFCNVSNILDWDKRIMVLGKSCSKATVGFTKYLAQIFKNLKLVGSNGSYLIQNADLEEVIKVGVLTVGTFRQGIADLTLFDYKTDQVSYRGGFKNNKKHGEALCAYANRLEPCRYNVGTRIDETHLARVAQKKREEESARLARQAQNCSNSFNKLDSEMTSIGNLGSASCQVHINSMLDALDIVVRRADCGACGQRAFKNASRSAYSCVKENREQLTRANNRGRYTMSALSKNACLDNSARSQMRRGIDNLQRDVANQLSSIDSSRNNLKSEYQRIIWPKLERISVNNNAVWIGAINAFKGAANDILAQRQQNHNVQLGLIRQQQQLQKSLKIQRSNVQAKQNYAIQKQKTTSITSTKAFVDPQAAAKKSCLASGRTWNGEYCNVISTIKFPGRACYDPSGKTCKTGETVYYNKNTGNYKAAFQRSDASIQAKYNGGSNQGGSNQSGTKQSGSDTSTGSSGAGASTGSDTQAQEPDKGAVKAEALSYCWQNKKKTSWYCHGTLLRTLSDGESLETAKGISGCKMSERKKAFKDGYVFYCGYGMESYHDDIAAIYDVSGALLGARNNYQCKRFSQKTCRDIM
jgi:hypothetical protein